MGKSTVHLELNVERDVEGLPEFRNFRFTVMLPLTLTEADEIRYVRAYEVTNSDERVAVRGVS